MHNYQIYRDPIPHPVLREGVVRKWIDFVCRTMAIAQLTHLHLTIPASGLVVEPVPEKCYRLFRFPERRCSFAWEVAVIESVPLCPADRETDSLIDPAVGDPVSVSPASLYAVSGFFFQEWDKIHTNHMLLMLISCITITFSPRTSFDRHFNTYNIQCCQTAMCCNANTCNELGVIWPISHKILGIITRSCIIT